jgi:hypothetical protein
VDAYADHMSAIPVAAAGLERGLATGEIKSDEAGRGLVRALWLSGTISRPGPDPLFGKALEALVKGGSPELDEIRIVVARALGAAFGKDVAGRVFFRTEAFDPRRQWTIYVNIELEREFDFLSMPIDQVTLSDPEGAELVGYAPLVLTFKLPRDAALAVDLPLFRLLMLTLGGTLPSSADLERFYQLRRAAEILGQRAAQDAKRDLLLEDGAAAASFQVYRRGTGFTARPIG